MLIGILQTGEAPDVLSAEMGDYPDMFRRLLDGKGFAFRTYRVLDMDFPASVHDCDGWLITGSRHGVYEEHAFIPPLEAFIRAAREARVPLVGICFGHQIVAQALGGRVERSDKGWAVGPTAYDFGGDRIVLNAWHRDQVIEPPDGAEVIASNSFCENAALLTEITPSPCRLIPSSATISSRGSCAPAAPAWCPTTGSAPPRSGSDNPTMRAGSRIASPSSSIRLDSSMSDWTDRLPEAARAYIADRRVDEVECILSDIAGVARGKAMPAFKFGKQTSFFLPNSIFLQTITGEWADNPSGAFTEPDMILIPDYSTATAAPWTADVTLQVIHDAVDQQGRPVPVSPRNVLRRVVELYNAEGWTPIVAPEMEFFLVARNIDPNMPVMPPMGRTAAARRPSRPIPCRPWTNTARSSTTSTTSPKRRASRSTASCRRAARVRSRSTSPMAIRWRWPTRSSSSSG